MLFLTFLGKVRAFSPSWVYGGERFLKMGDLVKIGGLPLSRWVFCFRCFFLQRSRNLSLFGGGCGRLLRCGVD